MPHQCHIITLPAGEMPQSATYMPQQKCVLSR